MAASKNLSVTADWVKQPFNLALSQPRLTGLGLGLINVIKLSTLALSEVERGLPESLRCGYFVGGGEGQGEGEGAALAMLAFGPNIAVVFLDD